MKIQVKLLGGIRTDAVSTKQEVQIIYRYSGNYTEESSMEVSLGWVVLILIYFMLH